MVIQRDDICVNYAYCGTSARPTPAARAQRTQAPIMDWGLRGLVVNGSCPDRTVRDGAARRILFLSRVPRSCELEASWIKSCLSNRRVFRGGGEPSARAAPESAFCSRMSRSAGPGTLQEPRMRRNHQPPRRAERPCRRSARVSSGEYGGDRGRRMAGWVDAAVVGQRASEKARRRCAGDVRGPS